MRIIALLGVIGTMAVPVQAQERFVEGTHYDRLPQTVRTTDENKIEVTEVFWYGCGHCNAFEPLLADWTENLADDVQFVRSPGMWNEMMETHAKLFYVAKELNVLEEVHSRAFEEIHERGNYLDSKEAIANLFSDAGVEGSAFEEAWNSFSVNSAVSRAGARMRDYGVRGVPSLIVNGKYRISAGGEVQSQSDMLEVAEFLIEKERNAS